MFVSADEAAAVHINQHGPFAVVGIGEDIEPVTLVRTVGDVAFDATDRSGGIRKKARINGHAIGNHLRIDGLAESSDCFAECIVHT